MKRMIIKGIGISKGKISAKVLKVRRKSDLIHLSEPRIIIVHRVTMDWLPYFENVLGVISETGGMTSHVAIIAREFGIPAVAGARNAMTKINDGETVTIDGENGIVEIMPEKKSKKVDHNEQRKYKENSKQ